MKNLILIGALIGLVSCSGLPKTSYEVFRTYDETVGNLAISSEQRVFISLHPFSAPQYKVVEDVKGKLIPYPNKKVSSSFANVIGLRVSQKNELWMLDMGGRLLGWNIKTNKKIKEIDLKSVSTKTSFLQDFALDQSNGFVYIADMSRADLLGESTPAIIAVNLKTGAAKRLLTGSSTVHSDGTPFSIKGKPVTAKTPKGNYASVRLGLNPITISSDDKTVFYGSMNGAKIYSIPSQVLRDFTLTDTEVELAVKDFGDKLPSDGITVDSQNNVYSTDSNNFGIGVTTPDGEYSLLFEDQEKLIWPDGFSCGGDGNIYFTVNKLHLNAALNKGIQEAKPPYLIGRFKPVAPCHIGR